MLYVRGEVIFLLFPFFYFFPVFFETHQIRNHDKWYRFFLRRINGVVVITERLKLRLVQEFGISAHKILVARDAVNIDRFMNVPKDLAVYEKFNLPRDKKIVMYTGSLGVEKGVHTLADAAPLLSENVHVVFVGGLEYQVPAFKERYGSFKNISIVGQVDHHEIPRLLACADIVVLPDLASDTYSNLYTSPMKLFEYMASAKCIVASDIPSLREVLNEQNAYFFASGDIQSLSSSIHSAIDAQDASAEKAKTAGLAALEYTWDRRAQRIISFVGSLI